ncbi:MAG: helix-turn-helix domain-containing protein [Gammaproteobacteria bacterium]|nr:helix-turn-helix domain-containing protein [Gammaproteobacteria bacterium]
MDFFDDYEDADTPEFIGTVVRALRMARGLSVNQLAIASGIEPANLSRFERNVRGGVHASKHLNLIAKRLGTRASVLYAIAELIPLKPNLLENSGELAITATELTHIIDSYPHLEENTRDKVQQIILDDTSDNQSK